MLTNKTIHYSELPPAQPGSLLPQEWETYRREVGRLLAEGNEGRWVLIKGERIVGVYATEDEACAAGLREFLTESHFIQQVREREPVYSHRLAYLCRM